MSKTRKRLEFACKIVFMVCLWLMLMGYLTDHQPNRWAAAFFFGIWLFVALADVISEVLNKVMYHRYVGKQWIYHCPGHDDGTECELDGKICTVFPFPDHAVKGMEYLEQRRNSTVFVAQFADGEEGYCHIRQLGKI